MAVGGYKCVKFSWSGGRSDSAEDRTKFVLNGVADAIISADVGWSLDTLTPTSSDFLTMPSSNNSTLPNLLKVLKLEYNSHTYRLGIGLVFYSYQNSLSMKPTDCVPTMTASNNNLGQTGYLPSGLYVGLIKNGTLVSDATYNWIWDGNGQFIRWSPFCVNYTGNNINSFVRENNSSYSYTYFILLKNAQIAVFAKSSAWTGGYSNLKCIVLGEVFKETGHTTDPYTLGAFYLHGSGTANNIGESGLATVSNYQYGIITEPGTYQLETNWSRCSCHQCFKADGTSLCGIETTGSSSNHPTTWCVALSFDQLICTNYVCDILTSGRWTPVYMWIFGDKNTYSIVPGDSFKGFLDTDLIRGVNPNYSYGQQLDNGNFVYLGGGFAIGWDASNTTLLF